MKKPAYLLFRFVLAMLAISGTAHALTAEAWHNLRQNPSVLTLQQEGIAQRAPDSTVTLTAATLSNLTAGTGVRLRGTITPTVTGQYMFAISGSRNATLWLSPDASRFSKQPIAWFHEPTSAQQWGKFASQTSAPVQLEAGISYYIEAQIMSSSAGGHFALGWKSPGASAFAVMPNANLSPIQPGPADLNDNNLPDGWEAENGLDTSTMPGALAEHGDPDNDGISNFEEFLLGTNPLEKEAISGGLTRDTWQEIQGQQVSRLTGSRARFLSHPNATSHVPGIDENRPNQIEGKNYGARYRGFLIAPATGVYHLWIGGSDEAELWFADGTVTQPDAGEALTNRFGKELLAHTRNPGGQYSSAPRDFNLIPSQRTRALHLVEGQSYYIEVLHKNEGPTVNHVALAWTPPGGIRTIVPASAFQSDIPEDDDADNDSLPDSGKSTSA